MAMYAEIKKAAREDMDIIVGLDRLSSFEDYDSLPYIYAIIMECSRWIPVVPPSAPHRVIQDDYYKGYFIPEGTAVFAVSKSDLKGIYELSSHTGFTLHGVFGTWAQQLV
jgi:cytochrome P450